MNFEELQTAWKDSSPDEVSIPSTLEQLKSAQQPIDRITGNMRKEIYYQVASILLMGVFPIIFQLGSQAYRLYYLMYVLMMVISIYYFYKFYRFFRQIPHYNNNSKDSLYELYYQIRLNLETYKSFSFLLLPFAIMASLLIIFDQRFQPGSVSLQFSNRDWGVLTGAIIGATVAIIITVNWWVEYFYGKYARQIRKLLDELREP